MAARQPTSPRPTRAILVSAEEKAARAQLVQAAQMGVVANSERIASASKGAFEQRPLRRGGTELAKYDTNRFTNTYGKPIGTYAPVGPTRLGGAAKKINRRDPGTRRTPPQKPAASRPTTTTTRRKTRTDSRRTDARKPDSRRDEVQRTRDAAERRRLAAKVRAAARRKRERAERDKGRGTEKATGGRSKAS